MSKPRTPLDFLLAALVLAVAVYAASALFVPHHLHGHSSNIDLQRQLSLDSGIRVGVWYPRWAPFTYFGYGSPLFNFYAPLAYYVAEIPVLAGASIMNGLKAAYTFAVIAAGLCMFLYGRELAGRWAGFVAGCLYVLAPYVLCNLYVRAALSEVMVFWEAALLLYLLLRYRRSSSAVWVVAAAALFAVLVLTHNIGALIYAAVVPAYCLISFEGGKRWISCLTVPAGLVLSAFFWVPALVQRGYVHAEESLTAGYFSYASHFLYPMQLIVHRWGFGASNPGPDDDLPLMIGLVHLAGVALFLAGWRLARRIGRDHAALLALLAAAIFLTLPWSDFIWRHVSLLRFVQFPWRFLGFVALASSALAGSGVALLGIHFGNRAAAALACALVFAALAVYGPHVEGRSALWDRQSGEMQLMMPDMLPTAILSGRYIEAQDLLASPSDLVRLGGNATSGDEYLPAGVKEKPAGPPAARFRVMSGDASLSGEQSVYDAHRVTATSSKGAQLACEVFYFPGWSVKVDGRTTEARPLPAAGTVTFAVPAGTHAVEVAYAGTGLQRGCGWISGLGWIGLIGLAFGLKPREPDRETNERPRRRAAGAEKPQDGMPGRRRKR